MSPRAALERYQMPRKNGVKKLCGLRRFGQTRPANGLNSLNFLEQLQVLWGAADVVSALDTQLTHESPTTDSKVA